MVTIQPLTKIPFQPITLGEKSLYEQALLDGAVRGCEFSFPNVFLWGAQQFALVQDHLVLFSRFGNHIYYPNPLGRGEKKAVFDAIIADAQARGLPCQIIGLDEAAKKLLETLYPGRFAFSYLPGSFDYVYRIDDLAELKGKKYHSKRNHLNRFQAAFPHYSTRPLDDTLLPSVRQMVRDWYSARPDGDYALEQAALEKALSHYRELGMEGLVLLDGTRVLALTLGSRLSHNTFDVNFEKAVDINGAYTAINYEFARYIREKYPEIEYLDREEDMGVAGLRKAKRSYHPHHMVQKYRAILLEETLCIGAPSLSQIPALRSLWQEAFGDTEAFLDSFFETAFRPSRCRIITAGEQVVAALYWFDGLYQQRPIAYVYAVATAKAYRGRGLSKQLLADTHCHLKAEGYTGVVLVPGSQALFEFYQTQGYETCSYIAEFSCDAATNPTEMQEITAEEYATLRRQFLPSGGVLQERENLAFLARQATLFAGDGFVLAARANADTLFGVELLGDTTKAPNILRALGYAKGNFRTAGTDRPFAMYFPLETPPLHAPTYFGLAFD